MAINLLSLASRYYRFFLFKFPELREAKQLKLNPELREAKQLKLNPELRKAKQLKLN